MVVLGLPPAALCHGGDCRAASFAGGPAGEYFRPAAARVRGDDSAGNLVHAPRARCQYRCRRGFIAEARSVADRAETFEYPPRIDDLPDGSVVLDLVSRPVHYQLYGCDIRLCCGCSDARTRMRAPRAGCAARP